MNGIRQARKDSIFRKNPNLKIGRVLIEKNYLTENQLREIYNKVKTIRDRQVSNQDAMAGKLSTAQAKMEKILNEAASQAPASSRSERASHPNEVTNYKTLITGGVIMLLIVAFGIYQLVAPEPQAPKRIVKQRPAPESWETPEVTVNPVKDLNDKIEEKKIKLHL